MQPAEMVSRGEQDNNNGNFLMSAGKEVSSRLEAPLFPCLDYSSFFLAPLRVSVLPSRLLFLVSFQLAFICVPHSVRCRSYCIGWISTQTEGGFDSHRYLMSSRISMNFIVTPFMCLIVCLSRVAGIQCQ